MARSKETASVRRTIDAFKRARKTMPPPSKVFRQKSKKARITEIEEEEAEEEVRHHAQGT